MLIRIASLDDIKGIAKVHVDSWKTTYKELIPDFALENLTYEAREELWKSVLSQENSKVKTFVAELDGEVIGFSSGGPERTKRYGYSGEIYTLYLLQEHQKKGIGKNLMRTLVSSLQEDGLNSIMVWVIEENPSRAFYDSFSPEKVDVELIEEWNANEIALGWKDAGTILQK
ncbi:GNAT family N-acetyltransferase [Peribacillus acanthi]|uniref:GNAT family N-acetyltransferase n=1 Tax=Peribacillus acanthi TaxID=2171554 RepID=UPI000D3ECD34|nr:GNAT family N-acetyltransferase [Peribacillus acanthi]